MIEKDSDILVSVCMITYNHENFIGEAIESIVSQQTSFPFELVISEDCGPDRTREICREYQQKYPSIIRLNFSDKNQGPQKNVVNNIAACKGKYIALCEGDDFWTSPQKLQKQVDYLEQNPTYSMCTHAAQVLQGGNLSDCIIYKTVLTTKDILLEDWAIMTASIMFRKDMFVPPTWFVDVKNGDLALQLLCSLEGNIGYIPEKMSIYRQHPGGISATLRPLNQAAWLSYLLFHFQKHTGNKYKKSLRKRVKRMFQKQIGFAKEYHLRKAAVILTFFQIISPIAPYLVRYLRK